MGTDNELHRVIEALRLGHIDLLHARCRVEEMEDWYTDRKKRELLEDLEAAERREEALCNRLGALLAAGDEDLEEEDAWGRTPLRAAIASGVKRAAALVRWGDGREPDGMEVQAGGMTLALAAQKGDAEAVCALLWMGAGVEEPCGEKEVADRYFRGAAPLACALMAKHLKVARLLLAAGADPNRRDDAGMTAVARWLQYDDLHCSDYAEGEPAFTAMFDAFLAHGWQPEGVVTPEGETALALACRLNSGLAEALLAYLLARGADVDCRDRRGCTPLIAACGEQRGNWVRIVELLLRAGADVSATDGQGNTALHCLAGKGGADTREAARLFFALATPDTGAVNNEGRTPADIALERNNGQLAKLFFKHG